MAVVLLLAGCSLPTDPPVDAASSSPGPAAPAGSAAVPVVSADDALALLATVPVKGRAPRTGYERETVFGPAWADVDGNGCDTRNDVLARDLTQVVLDDDGCTVLTGRLADPYTGAEIAFSRGVSTSSQVQVDHVVPLSDAWQKGAQQLSQAEREALANDPLNLMAVDGRTNESKGDGDAATWLPPRRAGWCTYVTRQVQVKAGYRLWTTAAEHDRIAAVLTDCAGAPPATPTPPAGTPEPPTDGTVYPDCAAARAAGAAPLRAGQPGYDPGMDGDGDGVACE
ncbi:DUF1524 domain-containing protein [Modestobacter sp. I12A-02628]|uniref:HNH endonuclease n=2 Tax=Goekera deserti TaxID=2497753 RepID=A0A7K3WGS4_9ACTN|nr:DUF1524 domain-containing protein [Goekera deserti]NDI48532.1 DUF1524 domain-containing protein [Goekera deserti]NEL55089.1 HNH endonuclease [Goekera deserti]